MRTVIVHYHIFKNAGTSIDRILKRSFGDRWATLEGPTPISLLRPEHLRAFAESRPDVCAVSSHLLRPPAPEGLRVLPVVLIRHPLDRAFSVYSHYRRCDTCYADAERAAQQMGFADFLRWCLDNKTRGGMVIGNYQVIHLSAASFRSGHIFHATACEDDLRQAIAYLADGPCVGTVDRFDAAVAKLGCMATQAGLPIARTAALENVTAGRPSSLEARLSITTADLSPALHSRFVRENRLDYRLYEWAKMKESA